MIELIELKRPISLADVERVERWRSHNRIQRFYPDQGPLRRELYPKHLAFFAAGAEHRERIIMAANRVSKTQGVGAYEVTCPRRVPFAHLGCQIARARIDQIDRITSTNSVQVPAFRDLRTVRE